MLPFYLTDLGCIELHMFGRVTMGDVPFMCNIRSLA